MSASTPSKQQETAVAPLRLGIAGLGTVGIGVLKLLEANGSLIASRTGRPLVVTAVNARSKDKDRGVSLQGIRWVDNALDLASAEDVDVVVEVIGGSEGIARELVQKSLENGKAVVTANKALIAHHGLELASSAETSGAMLAFEAAVAGGIPVVKTLREGLAANEYCRVIGILNGTCNYILSQMWEHRKPFDAVLAEAQALGYAEAEPSFDVDGIDAAHKLAIIASLAFGCPPAIDHVYTEGIRKITVRDMEFADELGYFIKLLGIASWSEMGLRQRVNPCLVPKTSPLANVHDVFNAVVAEGNEVGKLFLEGRGAGAGPTASSVVADIMDIARGFNYAPFTIPVSEMKKLKFFPMEELETAYYMRMAVIDRPGVLADITGIFRDHNISVHSFLQHQRQPGEEVQVVLTTHRTREADMRAALDKISNLASMKEPPYLIRIEEL